MAGAGRSPGHSLSHTHTSRHARPSAPLSSSLITSENISLIPNSITNTSLNWLLLRRTGFCLYKDFAHSITLLYNTTNCNIDLNNHSANCVQVMRSVGLKLYLDTDFAISSCLKQETVGVSNAQLFLYSMYWTLKGGQFLQVQWQTCYHSPLYRPVSGVSGVTDVSLLDNNNTADRSLIVRTVCSLQHGEITGHQLCSVQHWDYNVT